MTRLAKIFADVQSHIASRRFITGASRNKQDIRAFTFDQVDLGGCRDILDLGCAYGFFTRGLAGRLHPDARAHGIDLWPECEGFYVEACRESGFNGRFCADRTLCSDLPDDSFDLALCSYTLYFFAGAIPEIARVLRPSGTLIAVTHSVPHMPELVAIVKHLLSKHLNRSISSLPLEKLFDAFSDANGLQMLSPWFRDITEKHYDNVLQIDTGALPGLIEYLCFKRPLFFPEDCALDDRFIKSVVADHFQELLRSRKMLPITKNDTVYICRHPLKKSLEK